MIVDVVIPAYNEEASIGSVIRDIPKELVREIIICNNNSTDNTETVAKEAGATVILARRPGYGSACLAGINYLKTKSDPPHVLVFLDGDYSDHPEELPLLLAPINEEGVELVIGSRALGDLEKGAMQVQQVFGNWLATTLIKIFYKYEFTDLGPFRAVTWSQLMALDMQDPDFGWTVEMQVKAAKMGMATKEVPVSYRKRIGVSKISGTVKGTILAGHKILWTIFKLI